MSKLFLVLLPVVLLVGAGAAWIALNEPIRAVRVEGTLTHGEQRVIRDVVTHSLDQPLLSLDLNQVKQQIRSLSWPREVSVRKIWPATLLIIVEKEAPVARWGGDEFLTSDAKVVQLQQRDETLPGFDCHLSAPKEAMEVFQQLQDVLADYDLIIRKLEESASGEWQVTLHNGVTVMLGSERLLNRIHRFTKVYDQALSKRADIAHVDARYSNGVAVRWQPVGAIAMLDQRTD
ncbi:MAG: cell division protein FtsQ/DivIB [Gammaproteobacteria bacterium]|nr:cell division protein FtsQ/DivIB [Gammaproteobacteria bacterium]